MTQDSLKNLVYYTLPFCVRLHCLHLVIFSQIENVTLFMNSQTHFTSLISNEGDELCS